MKTTHKTLTTRERFHNFMRPHEALKGKTPVEVCGIEVVGENKWITLIQNASHLEHQKNNGAQ